MRFPHIPRLASFLLVLLLMGLPFSEAGAQLVINATPANARCGLDNGRIDVFASNGTAPYQYSIDGTNFQTSNIFNRLLAGSYTVTVRDALNVTGNIIAVVGDIPSGLTISATATPALCNNEGTITISATGGTAPYDYRVEGLSYQPGNTFTGRTAGNYIAWVRDDMGCMISTPVTVLQNCPSLSVTVAPETCGGGNGSITATGGGATPPYTYSIDGTTWQSSGIFANLVAGNYSVTVKDALGAVKTNPAVVINVCPTVTAVSTNGLCGTANASITATGAAGTPPYTYSIDGTNFQPGRTFNALANGTYTVTVKDFNGLTNTTTATVQNFPGATIAVASTDASCLNNDAGITITATGGTAPLQYSINGTDFVNGGSFNTLAAGNYMATVKDANGCLATQPVTIASINNLVFTAGSDVPLCAGATTTFANTSNAASFSWSPATGLSNATILNPTATPATTTQYTVTASLGICTTTGSVKVVVNPLPLAIAGEGVAVCSGEDVQLNGAGGVEYQWTPATYLNDAGIANPVVVNPTATTTYSLTVTDANGCKSAQPATVSIAVSPAPKVFAGIDTAVAKNQPFTLHAVDVNNSGITQYEWSPAFGLNDPAAQNPIVTPGDAITYTVTATTAQGCIGTDDITIKIYTGPEIYVPNAFSPNRDGLNDVLRAIPAGIKEFKFFNVYNRWGQLIFTTKEAEKGWDGDINRVPQTSGTFIWVAEGVDHQNNVIRRKGTVTLVTAR